MSSDLDRRANEFDVLKKDITDMKSLMSRMVEAMSRITVIEERQHVATLTTNRAIERMEAIAEKQHASELANANSASVSTRVLQLESEFKGIYVEGERNRARFDTIVWTVRGLWAVVGTSGFIWLLQALAIVPGAK